MWTTYIGVLSAFWNLSVTRAADLLAQSTPLIAIGLIIARLLRGKGAALQSAILRATVAAVVLCPLASLCLREMGVEGLSLHLPRATAREAQVPAPVSAWSPKPAEARPAESIEISASGETATRPSRLLPRDDSVTAPITGFERPAQMPFLASHESPAHGRGALVTLYTTLTVVWFAVSGFLLLRLLLAHLRMARLRRLAKDPPDTLTAACQALARDAHVRPPHLLISPYVKSPCLIGIFRPVILLPESHREVGFRALREVLVHELAHLTRRDCAWNLLVRIAGAVMFFQPLLSTLTRRIEEISDEVADDYVVRHGADRGSYAHQLVNIAERYRPTACEALAGMGVVSFKSSLGRRVQRILDSRRSLSTSIGALAGLVIALVGLCGTFAAGLVCARGEGLQAGAKKRDVYEKSVEDVASTRGTVPKAIGELKPPFTFRIRTVTPEGKPQPGVNVRCLHPRKERGEALVNAVAASDEKGIVEFRVTRADLLRDRYYWFSLADDQFVGTYGKGISPVDDQYESTLRVAPTEEFLFVVLGENGKPFPSAKLRLSADDFRAGTTTHTNDEGRATARFADTKTTVVASAQGYAPTTVRGIRLLKDEPYEIRLSAGFKIRGKVVDEKGAPLSRVRIEAKREESFPFRYWDEFLLRGATSASGEFELKNACAGTYEIQAHIDDPDKPLFIEPVSARVGEGTPVARLNLQAKPGAMLKGRYVTKHHLRTANRQIFVDTFEPKRIHGEVQTGDDGTFAIHIPTGAHGKIDFIGVSGYHNSAKLPKEHPSLKVEGRGIRFRQVPPGIYDGIEVHFMLMGLAKGKVVDDAGQPFGNIAIVVRPYGWLARIGGDGMYQVDIPPDQEAWLEVMDSSARVRILETEPFRVKEGEIIEKNITIP